MVQIRNISDYENKFKEDLIKALSKPEPEPKTLKPEPETEPKSEPKPEIRVNKRKLRKLRKDFDELGHNFSKKEIKEYRKAFYLKTYIYYSTILKTAKLFGLLHHQAVPIYKWVLLKNRLKNVNFNIG